MRAIATAVVAAVLGTALLGAIAQPAQAATLDSFEADLVAQVNQFRSGKGLTTLRVSDTLTAAAKWMSTDMAARDYFAHTSLDGRSPTQRMADAGYPAYSTWTGEDLAAGYTGAAEVLQGWINSPAHYAVLTNAAYRAIGVGRAYSSGSTYGWYWTADFGGVVDSTSAAAPAPAAPADSGFHAAWAAQSANPTLAPGQTTQLVVGLQNTGSRGWYVGSSGQQANLGTSGPLDVNRSDLASGWLSPNRPATTTTSYVGPGQVGWFAFTVRAPSSPGTYRLDLRGVIDGTTWLEDQGIYFVITVR
ncbi:MAG: CAP domain-containing protein [Candidatus Limnocylindria bacterium]